MKFRETETKPNQVPKQAKLFGEIRERWLWVEPSVWTERMLTAKCILCRAGVVFPGNSLRNGLSVLEEVKPPTGEPCAGKPHARFGGRGNQVTN